MRNEYLVTESVSDQHKSSIRQKLAKMIGNVSQLSLEELEPQTHFLELGLDSINLSQVRHSIKDTFALDVPMNEFFETLTTLELLTSYVAERVAITTDYPNQNVLEDHVATPINLTEQTVPKAFQSYLQADLPVSTSVYAAEQVEVQNVHMATAPLGLEHILEQQLHLMSQQLDVLRYSHSPLVAGSTKVHPETGILPSVSVGGEKGGLVQSEVKRQVAATLVPVSSAQTARKQAESKSFTPYKKLDVKAHELLSLR
ncbi:acyl carrier protein, partial [Paenibacillus sp. NRS-1780]|uniref:acyl carrier protein n=1 Tax=Paenibacillus sp. NRS-1780 TaxID=3233904 RepID=UPI003D2873F1